MIIILILLALALLLQVIAVVFFSGLPDSRTTPGRRVRMIFLGAVLCTAGALAAVIMIKVQEKTGIQTILSGGIESDARQWMASHRNNPPTSNQAGDNIAILRDGLTFLRTHPAETNNLPEAQATLARYSALPERPSRLLSHAEEAQYYEGAKAVYQLITNIAGEQPAPPASSP